MRLSTLIALSTLAAPALAQSFNYPNFNSTTGLVMNANAAAVGGILRVTPAAGNQRGSVWYSQPLQVANGFHMEMTFQFTSQSASGADGLAILFQNDPRGTAALGSATAGSCIGYADNPAQPAGVGITNSLALEIDTYDAGTPFFDVTGNDFSWHSNGTLANDARESFSIGWATPPVDFTNGLVHSIAIDYVPGTLSVTYDGNPLFNTAFRFSTGGVWPNGTSSGGLNLINGTSLYVGVTSATGGAWENNDVLSWSFSSGGVAPTTYCTAGTSTAGCTALMSAAANPSASLSTPCIVNVSGVEGQKFGVIFYGLDQLIQPWATTSTSFLCVKLPTQRSLAQFSNGTVGSCDGSFTLDWTNFQATTPGSLGQPWLAGETAHLQAWYRDPPAPKSTNLSNALTLTYLP